MVYVGLTDDYERRFIEHGKPHDWQCFGPFPSEVQARAWERGWVAQPGHAGSGGGAGAWLTASSGARFLKLYVGGYAGSYFVDVCVWPSEPADDYCDGNRCNETRRDIDGDGGDGGDGGTDGGSGDLGTPGLHEEPG